MMLVSTSTTVASEAAQTGEILIGSSTSTSTRSALSSDLRIGLIVGSPIGFSASLPLSERFAIHCDVGASTSERARFVASLDVLYLLPEVFGRVGESGWMLTWLGVGFRGRTGQDDARGASGFRAPFGISYIALDYNVEVFVMAAAGLTLIPERRGFIDGGVGLRIGL